MLIDDYTYAMQQPAQRPLHGRGRQGFRIDCVDAGCSHHRFINQHSGLCLQIDATVGLRQVVCNLADNRQKFLLDFPFGSGASMTRHVVRLKLYTSPGLCLDVLNGSEANGARIPQFPCHDGSNHRWLMQPRYD